jgi:hypothetical protein
MPTIALALLLQLAGQDPPRTAVAAWDTGTNSPAPLPADALLRRDGWKRLATGDVPAGDAAATNGPLLLVARRGADALELYSLGTGSPVLRARLAPSAAGPVSAVSVHEANRGSVGLEISWKGATLRFRLPKAEPFVESQALTDGAVLRVGCPSRFTLLPDFFADDILLDARRLPVDRVELPSENFLLHFAGTGDAIVMDVFENRDQEIRVALSGKGDERVVAASEIAFGKAGRKIWTAVLEGPGRWHAVDVGPADAKKILPLAWTMPFVAQWRVDFTRKDGLTDSWDLLLPAKDGDGFVKPSWLADDGKISEADRTSTGEIDRDAYKVGGPASDRLGPDRMRWTTVLGKVAYPCWTDRDRKGWLQPIEHKRLAFDGPVVIYPSNRLSETPVSDYTPVDVVRATLGVGPCQHILDVEGQKQEHVGRATCHVRTCLTETWTAGLQKAKRKEIEAWLTDAYDFVVHIRKRIQTYVDFGRELRTWLAEQKKARPELGEAVDALSALAGEFDDRVGARLEAIRTNKYLVATHAALSERKIEPTTPALVLELNRVFRETYLGYEGADWKERFKKDYTDPLTAIGGQQDEMVGECRWVAKALRQKAALAAALDPRLVPLAAEIRVRTQKVLRGGAAYEGARH